MADEILRSKHAFGDLENVDQALLDQKIDAHDILFLDEKTRPKVGWINKNGEKVIVEPGMSESEVTDKIESSVNETKAYADEKVTTAIEESKAYADEKIEVVVEEKLSESMDTKVSEAVDTALVAYTAEKFEIVDAPEGTLVNYSDNEIRIMIPNGTVFTKQSVGVGGDPNTYYVTLKTYFTEDEIVGYREHLGDQVDAEILKDIKTDADGRRYQPSWLGVAKYDESSDTWSYYGDLSDGGKYIGWDYRIDKYDANDVMIASDFVRINLSNENCHFSYTPSYVSDALNKANAYTDKKIAEATTGFEIVEF